MDVIVEVDTLSIELQEDPQEVTDDIEAGVRKWKKKKKKSTWWRYTMKMRIQTLML